MLGADLPFKSYETPDEAVENAKRLVAAGAEFVKAEGGREILDRRCARSIAPGIPFCGHLGMLPQHVLEEGGYHVKGKNEPEHQALLEDAQALADAGAFAIVLELVTPPVAKEITSAISDSHHRHRQRAGLRRADSGDADLIGTVPVVHAAFRETAGELRGGNQGRRGGLEKFPHQILKTFHWPKCCFKQAEIAWNWNH